MQALTVLPRTADSTRPTDLPEPPERNGSLLVEGLAVGVCGTDREIVAGECGQAPPGAGR